MVQPAVKQALMSTHSHTIDVNWATPSLQIESPISDQSSDTYAAGQDQTEHCKLRNVLPEDVDMVTDSEGFRPTGREEAPSPNDTACALPLQAAASRPCAQSADVAGSHNSQASAA